MIMADQDDKANLTIGPTAARASGAKVTGARDIALAGFQQARQQQADHAADRPWHAFFMTALHLLAGGFLFALTGAATWFLGTVAKAPWYADLGVIIIGGFLALFAASPNFVKTAIAAGLGYFQDIKAARAEKKSDS
jgi:hypothetical protein